MTEQPRPAGAVFLSYASQDADAASRICEALREAGIEVWFDRSELRGGDAWDSQIKKQIHDCALFLPLISAHTTARTEGYFRREWNLAKRRLLDRAEDVAFLVPVVIDETAEADARVPEEFLHVQWTKLPNGDTPPAFAQRVRQLLGLDPAPTHGESSGNGCNQAKCQKIRFGTAKRLRWPPVRPSSHRTATGSGRWSGLVHRRHERRSCGEAGCYAGIATCGSCT